MFIYFILPTVKLSRAITEPLSPDCMLNPYVLFICDLLSGGVDCLHSGLYLIKRILNVFQLGSCYRPVLPSLFFDGG